MVYGYCLMGLDGCRGRGVSDADVIALLYLHLLETTPDFPATGPLVVITDGRRDRIRVRRNQASLLSEAAHCRSRRSGRCFGFDNEAESDRSQRLNDTSMTSRPGTRVKSESVVTTVSPRSNATAAITVSISPIKPVLLERQDSRTSA